MYRFDGISSVRCARNNKMSRRTPSRRIDYFFSSSSSLFSPWIARRTKSSFTSRTAQRRWRRRLCILPTYIVHMRAVYYIIDVAFDELWQQQKSIVFLSSRLIFRTNSNLGANSHRTHTHVTRRVFHLVFHRFFFFGTLEKRTQRVSVRERKKENALRRILLYAFGVCM